jgi:hypothetical protein
MAVLTKTPPNEDAARRVVGARWAAPEPRGDILLPTGRPLRDTRRYAWTSERGREWRELGEACEAAA